MAVLILIASAFVATNVDNGVLLVGWLTGRQTAFRKIAIGYAIAVIAVLVVALSIEQVTAAIPLRLIGYLGLVPMLLGGLMLLSNIRNRSVYVATAELSGLSIFGIAVTLFSSSIDTVLVFSALLADSASPSDWMIVLGYLLTAAVWLFAAQYFSRHAARFRMITKVAEWAAPVMMIIVGFYILNNTATDVMPG